MRRIPFRGRASVAGLLALVVLSSCGSSSSSGDPAGETAFVHSMRSNIVTVDAEKSPFLVQIASEASARLDTVTVVSSDGQPAVGTTLQLRNDAKNGPGREKQDAINKQTVLTLINSSAAATGEANLLQATAIAADAIRRATGPRTLVIIDNGLQTVAPLRFQDGLLDPATDPAKVAAFVQSVGAVPDLSGMDVVWLMVQARAPQPALTSPAQQKAKAIWSAVLALGNPASLTFVDDGGPAGDTTPAAPPVTVVPVPDIASFLPQTSTGQQPLPPVAAPYQADKLGFKPDSAEFTDRAEALKTLSVTAQQLIAGQYCQIQIQGTTADLGDLAGQEELGLARATAVRDLLVNDAHVPAECIVDVRGVGSKFDGFVPDRNSDGSLNESAAALNRLVLITAPAPANN